VTGVFDAVTSVVAVGLFVEPDPFEADTVLKVVATGLGAVVVAALTFVATSSALATDESKKRNNKRMDNNRRGR
jgi:hypothetical protein